MLPPIPNIFHGFIQIFCPKALLRKVFIKNASQSVEHGWEVVEKCILGQRGYEKAGAIRGEGEMREGR